MNHLITHVLKWRPANPTGREASGLHAVSPTSPPTGRTCHHASCGLTCYLADAFIQNGFSLTGLSRGQSLWEQCGVKSLPQAPSSCVDINVAARGRLKQQTSSSLSCTLATRRQAAPDWRPPAPDRSKRFQMFLFKLPSASASNELGVAWPPLEFDWPVQAPPMIFHLK